MTNTINDRRVSLEGASNFRDMGGYRTADGRVVRPGHLFRADGLDSLTARDLDVLRSMGLRTVIDLRSTREVDERGRYPHEEHEVAWHHLSVFDKTWDRDQALARNLPAVEFLTGAYGDMLDEGAPTFARAFEVLASPDSLPAVFHCAAGKDRTGLLAALLLGSLGVPDETIVFDYALTDAAMPAVMARMLARYPERATEMAKVPAGFMSAAPAAMEGTLTGIDRRFGSIRGYVRSIGVADDVLDRLADALLTDT